MKYVIDEDVCKKYGLEFSEVLTLLLLGTKTNYNDNIKALLDKEALIKNDNLFNVDYELTEAWAKKLKRIFFDSVRTNPDADNTRLKNLAVALREIFPKGKKENEGDYYWRSNKEEVIDHLKMFFGKYGFNYTDEQILDAAKRYINPPDGNRSKKRTLKYFIFKNIKEVNAEGKPCITQISDLATMLENPETVSFTDDNWQSRVI